ncbi:MAG: hypothetical protein ACRDD1_06445, partial [Planctomycetia bacterium]
ARPQLAEPPAQPSIPNLAVGVSSVQETGKMSDVYSPSLSSDLKSVVFAAFNPGRRLELYIAERDDVRHPFPPPRRLAELGSPALEYFPALSPDGLELIFVRQERDEVHESWLWRTRRAAVGLDVVFDKPERLEVPGLPAKALIRHPHFYEDGLRLAVQVIDEVTPKADQRAFYTARRRAADSPFGAVARLPVDAYAAEFMTVSNDGKRLYGTTGDETHRINVSCRETLDDGFGPFASLPEIAVAKTCPVDGPIWVAPSEDLLFYVSSGCKAKFATDRRLRMFRFQ